MVKHGLLSVLTLSALLFTAPANSASDSGAKAAKSKPAAAHAPQSVSRKPAAPAPSAPKVAKPTLGDGLIAQNALRIYLNRPAVVTVHNSRGQLLFHIESIRPMEFLPLSGIHTGFLYLTLRAGPLETTKKLIYSGK